jgi:hypothetical protein
MGFARRLAMTIPCPICKSPAQELRRIGNATSFLCPIHRNFKVADTILAERRHYSRSEWQAALRKAKKRTKPMGWPLITSNDFSELFSAIVAKPILGHRPSILVSMNRSVRAGDGHNL